MKALLLCVLLMILTACSSKPLNLNYYLLSTPQAAAPSQHSVAQPQIILQPVLLADYLKQSSLVMQIAEHQMYFSRQDIWAERLDKAIQKTLLEDLNRSQHAQFRAYPGLSGESDTLSLTVQIDYFHPTFNSTVVSAGRYWIVDPAGQHSLEKPFYLSLKLTQDGYAHAVEKQRELLQLLATEIQQSLESSGLTVPAKATAPVSQS